LKRLHALRRYKIKENTSALKSYISIFIPSTDGVQTYQFCSTMIET